MAVQSFRELTVWQKAMELAKEVYYVTKTLPKEETYSLTSQLRRSAVSIPSNIAEGSKRGTTKDFVQFLRVADGSAAELETQLLLAEDLYTLETKNVRKTLDEVQRMTGALIKKLLTIH